MHDIYPVNGISDSGGRCLCGVLGDSLQLGASPLIVEALLQHIPSRTAYVASYGAESFLKAKYEGIQPKDIKEIFPKLIDTITQEIPI